MIPGSLYNFLTSSGSNNSKSSPSPAPLDPDPPSPFDLILSDHPGLPEPGPAHFEARRALWLSPPSTPIHRQPVAPSPSRARLEDLLNQPGALQDDHVWDVGLSRVWKALINGARLTKRLPLDAVVKILYAGWLRDGTWPEGAANIDEDNFFGSSTYVLPEPQPQSQPQSLSPLPVAPSLSAADSLASGVPSGESSAMAIEDSQMDESAS
ncbi:hypothetical protein EVG20_g10417 [Dentipellis fragilis]|uniref:DUF4050 domain-containing protein n=1 Tax=Dentipellis fragilis TaxID=205917 RepID=A0A4Y9XRP2_9AGAM|nr:hypothetical protein EVG20_g10417 [Dentipellis fragilis]